MTLFPDKILHALSHAIIWFFGVVFGVILEKNPMFSSKYASNLSTVECRTKANLMFQDKACKNTKFAVDTDSWTPLQWLYSIRPV